MFHEVSAQPWMVVNFTLVGHVIFVQNNVKYCQRLWKSSSDSCWEFLRLGGIAAGGLLECDGQGKFFRFMRWELAEVHTIKQHQRWSEKKMCRPGTHCWDTSWDTFSPHGYFLGTCMCFSTSGKLRRHKNTGVHLRVHLLGKAGRGINTLSDFKYDQRSGLDIKNLLNNPVHPWFTSALTSLKILCPLVHFY